MGSPYYRRRRRSLIRNLWIYRRIVALAVVLGLILWFVLTNNEQVTIAFPFGLGNLRSTTGLVILLSALVGSVATALVFAVVLAIRHARAEPDLPPPEDGKPTPVDDLPPPDYAAKTGDGLHHNNPWP
ncbi:lipopolysaccharide assembly protein LapA domain-containing protein [Tundrisphaera sp. TA3]|uniref:lipopolysaccharide assembly protein LapA domain-containing protein n=1 Tax=Tundrisphaera sp. TA3 TaxID=3435775 RepID=UPI003EBCC477